MIRGEAEGELNQNAAGSVASLCRWVETVA